VNKIDANSKPDNIINEYVGRVQPFGVDVFCPDTNMKVGRLSFDFVGFKGERIDDPNFDTGGAIIRGGFLLSRNADIKDGHGLAWIQTYVRNTSTSAGFPQVDSPKPENGPRSPFYPRHPTPGVSAPLFDLPNDRQTVSEIWLFESALVCYEVAKPENIQYLGSFQWSYSLDGKGGVMVSAPHNWSSTPSVTWFRAVNTFPTKLNVTQGCCLEATPGPSSWLLLALGAFPIAAAIWRGGKRACPPETGTPDRGQFAVDRSAAIGIASTPFRYSWRSRKWAATSVGATAGLLILSLPLAVRAGPFKVGEAVDVQCMGVKIGTLEIDLYSKVSAEGKNQITIDGGFDQTIDTKKLQQGATFKWVQTVKGPPVLYDWQKPDQTYIDRKRKMDDNKIVADGSPFYPSSPSFKHTIGYNDSPNRNAGNLPLDLAFETALVCVVGNKIMAVDSFTWGFQVSADGKTFKLSPLNHTDKVSGDLLMAFRNDPDPIFKKWEIDRGCCLSPEPASLLLLGTGTFGLLGYGWLFRRRVSSGRGDQLPGTTPCR
jgi:hypothetical protein